MINPLMIHNVVNCGTLGRVIVQDLGDEVASVICDANLLREVIRVHTNSFVGGLDIGGLEGRLANDKCVNNDTDRPDIDLV